MISMLMWSWSLFCKVSDESKNGFKHVPWNRHTHCTRSLRFVRELIRYTLDAGLLVTVEWSLWCDMSWGGGCAQLQWGRNLQILHSEPLVASSECKCVIAVQLSEATRIWWDAIRSGGLGTYPTTRWLRDRPSTDIIHYLLLYRSQKIIIQATIKIRQ